MATTPQRATAPRPPFGVRLQQFWQRVTDGLEVSHSGRNSKRSAHQLPPLLPRRSRENSRRTYPSRPPSARVKEFFWSVTRKTFARAPRPAARGIHHACISQQRLSYHDSGHELMSSNSIPLLGRPPHVSADHAGDRRPRRDEARFADRAEIQTWLLPGAPPQISGISIAYTTRPANHSRRRITTTYFRAPAKTTEENRVMFAVADVAGKKHSRRHAHGHSQQPQNVATEPSPA